MPDGFKLLPVARLQCFDLFFLIEHDVGSYGVLLLEVAALLVTLGKLLA